MELKKPTHQAAAILSPDGKYLSVEFTNNGSEPVQLLLQEWSVTMASGTSSIVSTDTPNGQVQLIVLSPISLPAGSSFQKDIFPRGCHHPTGHGTYFLDPMTDGIDCGSAGELKLTMVVFAGEKKTFETVTIPVKRQQVPNPKYRPPN